MVKKMPHLEITEVTLVLCSTVNKNYQQEHYQHTWSVLYIFVSNHLANC